MEAQLKQRLVGAAVLVAVAVIAVPIFLDGGPSAPPAPPTRELAPLPDDGLPAVAPALPPEVRSEIDRGFEADAGALLENLPPDTAAPAGPVADPAAQSPAPDPPLDPPAAATAEGPPAPAAEPAARSAPAAPKSGGWVVQLGSFSSKDNATALVEKLKGRGFAAFLAPLPGGDRPPAYRVRVGPTAGRQEAERLHARLTMEFSMQGMVMRSE